MMVRETEISTQYGIEIYEMLPRKGVYFVKTDKGDKCLKKISYGTQKLMYIYSAKQHIKEMGFNRMDNFFLTSSGLPYAMVNEDMYIMTDWIEGRECDFKNNVELLSAAGALAEFHTYARNFTPTDAVRMRNEIGRLPATFERRYITLNKMYEIARKNKRKSEFDYMYIENVAFFKKLAEEAIKMLSIEAYGKVCQEAMDEKVLCHHDYTYHNIILNKENAVFIVDFDYCKEEVQPYDIATLLVKALKRLQWDTDKGKSIIKSYSEKKAIDTNEVNVIKSIVAFPQRFWRLANRYYYKEAGWSEGTFNRKMAEIIGEKEQYVNFIGSMDRMFE